MATPDTCASNEKPWKPRNCWNISASSSEVRSAAVAMRQWSTSSWSLKSPMTVWVLPQSMASSMSALLQPKIVRPRIVRSRIARPEIGSQVEGEVERRGRLRDDARGDEISPGVGVGAHGVEGDAARALQEEARGGGRARE